MAKQVLPTNFMDDILNESMNGKRRWTITQNDDGTYTLEDATTYDQLGNTFGQAQVNEMNKAINESVDQARVIDDYKTLAAVNQNGFVPGAKPVAQLISDLGGLVFAQDADGNWGYKAGGADTVTPFKQMRSVAVSSKEIIRAGSSRTYNVKGFPHLIIIQASTGTAAGTEEINNWIAYSDGKYGLEFLFTRGGNNAINLTVEKDSIIVAATNLNISIHNLCYM